jgi:small redox-active disulfide protein 2
VKIELLGTQCSNCIALEKVVKEAIAKSGKFVEFEKVSELSKIVAYGVMTTPALVVDGKVVSVGKVLTVEGVLGLLDW